MKSDESFTDVAKRLAKQDILSYPWLNIEYLNESDLQVVFYANIHNNEKCIIKIKNSDKISVEVSYNHLTKMFYVDTFQRVSSSSYKDRR